MKRDLLTPAIVITGIVVAILFLWAVMANAQTHTFPGNNVFPSTSTTDFNAGATVDFTGATVTGLSGGVAWGGITGTLSSQTDLQTALNAKQTGDADLTTWAGVTPTAGIQTWLATPSSANLLSAVTDETGSAGALVFATSPTLTTPDFTTGFKIGTAAASGKIPIGNGTNYVASTPTFPTAAGAVGYTIRSDATNFASYPQDIINSSVTSQTPSTSEVYIAGSSVVVTAGDFKAKGQYRCTFDIVKSAGTGIPVVAVKIGTAGTTSDTTQLTFTFPGAGTSVADTGTIEVIANWRTVGSGSSAVVSGVCRAQKNTITAAGLWGTTTAALTIVSTVSGGFNSSAATTMGVTFNGGTAFSGTITTVQATLMQ